jgi:hypothetical protein
METKPSILLIREWEGQTSGSGCCGRLEGDFLVCGESQPVAHGQRSIMERMGPLYMTLKRRLGDSAEIEVIDPRNVSLFFFLLRDFWRYRVGFGQALRTLFGIPVLAVVVNGRIVARGEWPDAETVLALVGSPGPADAVAASTRA